MRHMISYRLRDGIEMSELLLCELTLTYTKRCPKVGISFFSLWDIVYDVRLAKGINKLVTYTSSSFLMRKKWSCKTENS